MKPRNLILITGTAEALAPIIHGGDHTGGTVTEFRREKMRVGDVFEYLPVISANAVTGILRRCCAAWCLDQLEIDTLTDLRAFDLLTSGGTLTRASGDKYVDLFEQAEFRDLFPVIGLLGASIGNRVLGGVLDVSRWVPICQETMRALPADLHPLAAQFHIEDLLQEVSFSRQDAKKNRDWQSYLSEDVLRQHQGKSAARAESDEADAPGAATSMRYGFEALAQGTFLSVEFLLRNPSPAEMGVFFGGLTYFEQRPIIGGRGARGFGKVKLDLHQYQFVGPGRVENPLAVETMEFAATHLVANRDKIQAILAGL